MMSILYINCAFRYHEVMMKKAFIFLIFPFLAFLSCGKKESLSETPDQCECIRVMGECPSECSCGCS